MVMDIQPSSVSSRSPQKTQPEEKRKTGNLLPEKKIRFLVFGGSMAIAMLVVVVWYALGAPFAPGGVSRMIGMAQLPVAGERDIPLPVFEQRTSSPLSGRFCEHADRRPIGVMMPSDLITRPASGFSFADAVIEMPALTNNITRLLAVFQCEEPSEIGSVRSARHDYLFLAAGLDAIIVHWGGSYHALNRIRAERNVYESLSALGVGQQAFYRKPGISAPHNGFTSYERLWNALVAAGYRQTTTLDAYQHVNDPPVTARGSGGTLTIGWPGQMRVRYEYDRETNTYARFWGGTRHVDAIESRTVNPKVLVVAYTQQRLVVPGEPYNDVDVEGRGVAEVYQNGEVVTGTWEKSEIHKQDPLVFRDENGNLIPFVRGQLWIHFVDGATPVTWTPFGTSAEVQ